MRAVRALPWLLLALSPALLVAPLPILRASVEMGPLCVMGGAGAKSCCDDSKGFANGGVPAPCCRILPRVPLAAAVVEAAVPTPPLVLSNVSADLQAESVPASWASPVDHRARTAPLFLLFASFLV